MARASRISGDCKADCSGDIGVWRYAGGGEEGEEPKTSCCNLEDRVKKIPQSYGTLSHL